MEKIATIKIIAGKFKGKILNAHILPHTRPTKAIVKESVFNTISPVIKDKVFIEVFAGYGSMGFEALSRGAREVIFLEKNKDSFKILQKNIAMFDSYKDKILAENADSFEILSSQNSIINRGDILYFDPPFSLNGELYTKIFNLLESHCFLKLQTSPQSLLESKIIKSTQIPPKSQFKNTMLIFEHNSNFQMPSFIASIPLQKTRKFGKTSISYYFRHDFC